jgi:hypothetical protein
MDRKQVKRLLALLKAEAEKGRHFKELENLPDGFKESFESQDHFRGWLNYHVTWDIDDGDHWKIISLEESKVEAWNRQLAERVPYITKAGETVTPQQFKAMEKAGVETLAKLVEFRQKKRGANAEAKEARKAERCG